MKLNYDEIFKMCESAQKEAYGKISVGAVCHAKKIVDGKEVHKYWSGANLHISDSFSDVHAEQLAVNLAILERYYPVEIFVTSIGEKENVAMCGSCRQYISEINRHCSVIVFNPDGTRKLIKLLSEVYLYSKDTIKKNQIFRELCNFNKKLVLEN